MRKILIIEDNQIIRENIVELLEILEYQAIKANNGKEGVHSILREKPDLILCDVHMPEMNGYQVLEFVKSKPDTASIPFVFVTSSSQKVDIKKGVLSGADSYLVKPFQFEELENTIKSLLD